MSPAHSPKTPEPDAGAASTPASAPAPVDAASKHAGAKKVIYAALVANFAIAISKFVAAAFTGSAAMLAEGVHSLVDTGNEYLLLVGIGRSQRAPDEWHPFGYGKTLYFWALIVAASVFSLGGGVSIYHGITSMLHPKPLEDPTWNYIVLGVAALFEGYSWHVSKVELVARKHPEESLWQVVRRSKDPSVFTVFIEDSAALTGIAIAALGIWLGHILNNPYIDPAASILIGVVLLAAAVVLGRETGSLLVGESADRAMVQQLRKIISSDPAVEKIGHLLTMQMGPNDILLVAEVQFRGDLAVDTVELAVCRLESAIKAQYPPIRHIYFGSTGFRRTAS
ncbi:cation diffusion facilitator family transporter [Paucimonas lemoignei]|uniref:cation diffusion facilitator family transporter n=1 Tax=Paucimonas lemoignei TaxID=29443 RepID=UPI001FB4BF1B|nr:cation diffusion facilitator family transporter [Paucimonas lemoignei]